MSWVLVCVHPNILPSESVLIPLLKQGIHLSYVLRCIFVISAHQRGMPHGERRWHVCSISRDNGEFGQALYKHSLLQEHFLGLCPVISGWMVTCANDVMTAAVPPSPCCPHNAHHSASHADVLKLSDQGKTTWRVSQAMSPLRHQPHPASLVQWLL